MSGTNVKLVYFNQIQNVVTYLKSQIQDGWVYINLTPSSYDPYPYDEFHIPECLNAHDVIGQEFDDIIVVVDRHFYYKTDNFLSTRGYSKSPYYHPTKMLYQNLSRARRKIQMIIYDNPVVLERCIGILNK